MKLHSNQGARKLRDLRGVGKSIEGNLHRLRVQTVEQLSTSDPDLLYRELERLEGTRQDPCVLDTFRCAVAQARDPHLPREQCDWWWWSRKRLIDNEGDGVPILRANAGAR